MWPSPSLSASEMILRKSSASLAESSPPDCTIASCAEREGGEQRARRSAALAFLAHPQLGLGDLAIAVPVQQLERKRKAVLLDLKSALHVGVHQLIGAEHAVAIEVGLAVHAFHVLLRQTLVHCAPGTRVSA